MHSIRQLNEDYGIEEFLPGCVGVGSDTSGVGYILDFRGGTGIPSFASVPLGDLEDEAVMTLGASFSEALWMALERGSAGPE